jgi:hypothetical protein
MSHSYKFTSDVPLIFSDLSHGPDVTVLHESALGEALPPIGDEGSTVVLYPGDILTVDKPLEHAWLVEVDAEGNPLEATPKPETATQKRKREGAEKKVAKEATTETKGTSDDEPADPAAQSAGTSEGDQS